MYSLSTCWNCGRHTDGKAMLEEVRQLGFQYAELSHGIRISLVPGILEAVESGLIQISSVHNFCPLPMGVTIPSPNIFQFSSEDPRERDAAYRNTIKTMEFANRVKARLVVLHMGSIIMKDYNEPLLDLIEKGQRETPRYEKLLQEAITRREKIKDRFMDRAHEILHALAREAQSRGLLLGIENREEVSSIPIESDLMLFFREFSNPAVCYWHDTGHAQIKENLGLIYHTMHVETYADRLAGFHIHDVEYPGHDHRVPGKGTVNFAALKPLVKPDHIKVFEFSPSQTTEDVQAGVAHLKGIWGEE